MSSHACEVRIALGITGPRAYRGTNGTNGISDFNAGSKVLSDVAAVEPLTAVRGPGGAVTAATLAATLASVILPSFARARHTVQSAGGALLGSALLALALLKISAPLCLPNATGVQLAASKLADTATGEPQRA